VSGWQERAPRSISRDYDGINSNALGPVADPGDGQQGHDAKVSSDANSVDAVSSSATSRPVGTQLGDVFISVKTTRNYHKWRLPVVLKTWFQLAKDQVRQALKAERRFGEICLLCPLRRGKRRACKQSLFNLEGGGDLFLGNVG
jgi:hypothetical protein